MHIVLEVKLVLPVVVACCVAFPAVSTAKPRRPAPRATVVKIMKESGQALVLDRNRGEYVVVKRGDTVLGHVVSDIENDQIVLSTPTDPPLHYVLPLVADAKVSPRAKSAEKQPPNTPYAAPSATEVQDPYATAGSADTGDVLDPYDTASVPTVLAPENSRVGQSKPPDSSKPRDTPAPTAPAPTVRDPYGSKPASKKSAPNKTAPTKVANEQSVTISRAEFDTALSDFQARSKEVQLGLEKRGVRIKGVSKGSFVARLGIRKNDLILTIAGHSVRNADEAAIVYVELSDAREFDLVLERNGAKHTIHYTFIK